MIPISFVTLNRCQASCSIEHEERAHKTRERDLVEGDDVDGLDVVLEVPGDSLDEVIDRDLEILDDGDDLELLDS
ncbi:hypothetical protein GCK72_008208 [Caenorhabditis remanei]|uniref:Uncharacterized protein n=1 Tax=Caenorhabditis remanei TaxID=31234 RepID=A0A6A5GZZ0_CAERE|nr:hypothetical protein GCK72_008208 [Caenorhabditis remanei]KAF1759963.1 hypothetical protein GCK72_008208 [Caenorhabditis remanei]